MGWRAILVSRPCRLSLSKKQLCYEPEEGTAVTVPLEDITAIVLENNRASMTTALLSEIAEKNIVLYSCDSVHMPNGCFVPFHQHSRYAQIAHMQQAVSLPLKKRLWQRIIRQKIANQAALLARFDIDGGSVAILSGAVRSGDADNYEALAARRYWPLLFDGFARDQKKLDPINTALNYGYAIVRGAVARSLVSYGLMPAFGLFHNSQLNAYNLADDLIEPLRPAVDRAVKTLYESDDFDNDLTPRIKGILISVLHTEMQLGGESVTLLHACDVMAKSLVIAMREKCADRLQLPERP